MVFQSDSLYKLSLNGSEGKFGSKIADEYSGTDAGNLANYYAGVAYLNTGNTLKQLIIIKIQIRDIMLSALAKGAIGDAYAQKNQPKRLLKNYINAAGTNKTRFTTPRFFIKRSW
jgi:hypothetical protein